MAEQGRSRPDLQRQLRRGLSRSRSPHHPRFAQPPAGNRLDGGLRLVLAPATAAFAHSIKGMSNVY
jgi:hypothetical protein